MADTPATAPLALDSSTCQNITAAARSIPGISMGPPLSIAAAASLGRVKCSASEIRRPLRVGGRLEDATEAAERRPEEARGEGARRRDRLRLCTARLTHSTPFRTHW